MNVPLLFSFPCNCIPGQNLGKNAFFGGEGGAGVEVDFIDHFHSFASIKISPTNFILKLIIQKSFYSETTLVRLI